MVWSYLVRKKLSINLCNILEYIVQYSSRRGACRALGKVLIVLFLSDIFLTNWSSGFQSFWNFPTDSYRVTIYSPLSSVTSEIGYENYKSIFYELNINTGKNLMQNLNWCFDNSSSSLNLKTEKRKNIGPLQKLCNGPTVHWFHEANGPMGPNTKSHQNSSAISVENFQFQAHKMVRFSLYKSCCFIATFFSFYFNFTS